MTKSENDDGSNPYVRVQVIDVDISLWSMVGLLVKLALAAIPAMLIIAILIAGVGAILGLIGASL